MWSASSAARSCRIEALLVFAIILLLTPAPADAWELDPRPQAAPSMVSTSPVNGTLGVSTGAVLQVQFSEPMETATLNVTFQPPLGFVVGWSAGNRTLTITPNAPGLTNCTVYGVRVEAKDADEGLDLVPGAVPNPWTFMTACDRPYLLSASPSHGERNVRLNRPVVVTFSEAINLTSYQLRFTPPVTGAVDSSDGSRTVVTTNVTGGLAPGTTYTVLVEAAKDMEDKSLVPSLLRNPWTFTTNAPPQVTKPVLPASSCLSGGSTIPLAWTMSDAEDPATNLTVTLSFLNGSVWQVFAGPSTGFPASASLSWDLPPLDVTTRVRVRVDDTGGATATSDSDTFRIDTGPPTVVQTSPPNGATNINYLSAVSLAFSEPMNTTLMVITLDPDVPGLRAQWTPRGDAVSLIPTAAGLLDRTTYTVTVTQAVDTCGPGRPMPGLPFTFSFSTGKAAAAPPSRVEVRELTDTSVSLFWTEVTRFVTGSTIPPGADVRYLVYLNDNTTDGGLGQRLGESTVPEWTARGLKPSTGYAFRIVAVVDNVSSDPTPRLVVYTRDPFFVTPEGQMSLLLTLLALLVAALIGVRRLLVARREREEAELTEEVRDIVAHIRKVRAERDPATRKALEEALRAKFQTLAGAGEETQEGLFMPTPQLEGLYRALAQSLVQSPEVDLGKGKRVVDDRLGGFVRTLAGTGSAYRMLTEAEASVESDLFTGLPESGRKALLLVYFYALEEYLTHRARGLIPEGATLLLGERGHINTRRRDWEAQYGALSLGNLVYMLGHNRHFFVRNEEEWESDVQPLLERTVDARNRTAHPSRAAPPMDRVRELVYRSMTALERVLNQPPPPKG